METTALTFAHPLWLWGLLILPLGAGLYVWSARRSRELAARFVASRLLPVLAASASPLRRTLRAATLLLALACALVALAQPRWGVIERKTQQKGRDVVVAIDSSRSMLATDMAPNRLARAKLFTLDLLRLLKGDRVGLVAFAGSAFLQAPLTLDFSAVENALEEIDTTIIPKGGTNLAAAISAAREAIGKAEGQTRALVILTDGEELDANGLRAAKDAAADGIRIFTVGVGSPEGSLIPIRTEDGRQDFVRDTAGKPVTSKLDSARLEEIAAATGGFYLPLSTDTAREVFSRGIEPMELGEIGEFQTKQPIERYQWPLGTGAVLLAWSLLLGDRRRAARAAMLAGFLLPSLHAETGTEIYNQGDYPKAVQAYEQQLAGQPGSAPLQFNLGAAAYKASDYEKAIRSFSEALVSGDELLRRDARYNLANSLVRQGEAAAESDAKKTNWENALSHYEEILESNPDHKNAATNRDVVKKLLEELQKQQNEKQDSEDQKQESEDQKEDSQDQKQDSKDQKEDSQDQKQDSKDQKGDSQDQKQDSKDQKGDSQDQKQDSKDQKGDSQDQKQNPQNSSDQSSQPNPSGSPTPAPAPTPGEKKEGELQGRSSGEPTPQPAQGGEAMAESAEEKDGEMSPSQARALLNSLRNEEEKVNLMQPQSSQEVLRDW
jgi:Ca-activated chloride channel family protein